MKRLVLLIISICLIIDDENVVIVKSQNVPKNKNGLKDIVCVLEDIYKGNVTKLKTLKAHSIYETTKKELLFVKESSAPESGKILHGEFEGLDAILDTKTVLVPNPITTGFTKKNNYYLVLEYLNATTINNETSAKLGSQLADMHLHNLKGKHPAVKKFGFYIQTSCGSILQDNTWRNDWITFFVENRLNYQMKLMNTTPPSVKSNITAYYWDDLKPKIPKFFEGIDVKPSLVHGNLQSKNIGRLGSKPVLFSPSAFYGHHEYDLAAKTYNDKYSKEFFDAYHKKIPKAKGFDNRIKLYHLFYLINDWNQRLNDGTEMINTIDELNDMYNMTSSEN